MKRPAFDLRTLSRAFAGVSVLFLFGVPLTVLANIVLARTLSVPEFGGFGFAISLATVLSTPVVAGIPMLLTREVSAYVHARNWSAYRGIVASAYAWVAFFGGAVGLGALGWLLLSDGDADQSLVVALLLVPVLGLNAVRSGVLKGLGHPVLAEAPGQIVQPLFLMAGFLALARLDLATTRSALWWYLTVTVLVLVVAATSLLLVQPSEARTHAPARADLPRWRRALVPFALMGAVMVLGAQLAVLLLGLFGTAEAVAYMRVAERGAQLAAFPLSFMGSVIGPYFVRAVQSDDHTELRRVARFSARLTFATSFPVALILVIFGRPILALTFGAPYDQEAYVPMVILLVAQVTSVAMGNAGILLAMTGRERLALYSAVLSVALIAAVTIPLAQTTGATGAALGAAAGIVGSKIFVNVAVRRLFSFSPGMF